MHDTPSVFVIDEPDSTQATESSEGLSQEFLLAFRESPPAWVGPSLSRLDHLADLQANWDSYGAPEIDRQSIGCAKQLLRVLSEVDTVEEPVVTASPEGNAALCWEDEERSLDVEIMPNGELSFAYASEMHPSWDHEGLVTDPMPLAFLLTRLK